MACAAVSLDVGFPYNYLFLGILLFSFFLTTPFIIVIVYKTKALLENQKSMMTQKTYTMHKELLRTLIFQLIVPGITLLIPYLVTACFVIMEMEAVAFVFQTNFVIGTLHSTMNTIMIVYFIKPYRIQFIRTFWDSPKLFLMKYRWNLNTHDTNW